jgi:hypothetical protein
MPLDQLKVSHQIKSLTGRELKSAIILRIVGELTRLSVRNTTFHKAGNVSLAPASELSKHTR